MAHAAIAFAKASRRKRMMACTTSIGPGATNMVTAAAVAHVNRLPVLLIPGDVFANRRPDPVLQQVEDFGDGTVSANDCFRPVSRYFDRITRPEQIVPALNRAIAVLTDPAECGPVTLAFCQDVQTEAYDYPETFFEERVHRQRRVAPDPREVARGRRAVAPGQEAARRLRRRRALFRRRARADRLLRRGAAFRSARRRPASRRLPVDHPLAMGAIGVTGTGAANALAAEADVIVGVGTRFADFTTGSWALFKNPDRRFIGINVQPFDAAKHRAVAGRRRRARRAGRARRRARRLEGARAPGPTPPPRPRPIGRRPPPATPLRPTRPCRPTPKCSARSCARARRATSSSAPRAACRANCTSCGGPARRSAITSNTAIPAWATRSPAAIGVKMALPDREVVVTVGDGSYLMMNSEIATSVMLGQKLIIVVLDNPRLRLHQPPAAGDRRRAVQQPAEGRAARGPAGNRFRRPRALAGRRGGQGRLDRRARGRVQGGARRENHPGDRHRHRSDRLDRRRRLLVGRRRARPSRPRAEVGAARRDYEKAREIQRVGD